MKRILYLLIFFCLGNLYCFAQDKDFTEDKFLIVLDVQAYYTINELPEEPTREFIEAINDAIGKTSPDHVIYVKTTHKALNLSLTYPFIYVSLDSAAMDLDKRLNLVSGHIFMKEESNAFTVEELTNFLQQNNATEIIIIGLMAEKCVYKSLIGGKELGYDMYMIPQAILGKSLESKDEAMNELVQNGIKTLDLK